MMRSVSIDEDRERFAALLGSDESQSASLRDLFVKVDKPEKHVEGYVSYNVTTTVSCPDMLQIFMKLILYMHTHSLHL